jgi:hypothetical protein
MDKSNLIFIAGATGYIGGRLLTVSASRIFEIGGKDQVSYRDIMAEYAR